MTPLEAAAIVGAGVGAGTINTVVGSGTLITFPTLLALGYPPVVANVANTVGLTPGSLTASWGYRRELRGQRRRLWRLGTASVIGGLLGGLLLLRLPEEAFRAIVPALIGLALVLVVLQPRLSARMAQRREREHARTGVVRRPDGGPLLMLGITGTGVYGGYFGAAQGVLLLGLMGVLLDEDLQTLNGVKNVLTGLVNGTAALLFIAVAEVDWAVAGLIAIGAFLGGLLGARIGRRLSPGVLRGVIVVVGVAAIIRVLTG